MKILKHFVKVAGYQIKRLTCNHSNHRVASCPFTGYTYTTCNVCMKRLSIVLTKTPDVNEIVLKEEPDGKA